jgi:hypothetical protein
MALDDQIDRQHRVLGGLRRARRSTAGWRDGQREKLEQERLSVLDAAGHDLMTALKKASVELGKADRLLG